uniref:ParB/Sulfiredoxin n=1 Tax=uncultured Caudovirales phage TaxID=2100421 RepID=A0A6J5LAB8_9CAUD|nr:ParB/Sulfiredoxin [uncultured Caudovirales phage]
MFGDLLSKAVKGAEKPGHLYMTRKPDGKGGWIYSYNPPAKGQATMFGDSVQAKPREAVPLTPHNVAERLSHFASTGNGLTVHRVDSDVKAPGLFGGDAKAATRTDWEVRHDRSGEVLDRFDDETTAHAARRAYMATGVGWRHYSSPKDYQHDRNFGHARAVTAAHGQMHKLPPETLAHMGPYADHNIREREDQAVAEHRMRGRKVAPGGKPGKPARAPAGRSQGTLNLGKGGFSGILAKGVKGEERPGHKYLSRKPDGKGGWDYTYKQGKPHTRKPDDTGRQQSLFAPDDAGKPRQLSLFDGMDELVPPDVQSKATEPVNAPMAGAALPLPPVHESEADASAAVEQIVGDVEKYLDNWQYWQTLISECSRELRAWRDKHIGDFSFKLNRKAAMAGLGEIEAKWLGDGPNGLKLESLKPKCVQVGGLQIETLESTLEQVARDIIYGAIYWRKELVGQEGTSRKELDRLVDLGVRNDNQAYSGEAGKLQFYRDIDADKVREDAANWMRDLKVQIEDAAALPQEHHDLLARAPVRVRFVAHPLHGFTNWSGCAGFERDGQYMVPMIKLSSTYSPDSEAGTTLVHEVGHMIDNYTGNTAGNSKREGDSHVFGIETGLNLTPEQVAQIDSRSDDLGYDGWTGRRAEWTAEAYRYLFRNGEELNTKLKGHDFDLETGRRYFNDLVRGAMQSASKVRTRVAVDVIGEVKLAPRIVEPPYHKYEPGKQPEVKVSTKADTAAFLADNPDWMPGKAKKSAGLAKALRGAEKPGHKYTQRKPDGKGGYSYLYHTAPHQNMDSVAESGLQPRGAHDGESTFNHGGYAEHSRGKVFFSEHPEAARAWHGKVEDQLQAAADEPERHVAVMLRVKGRKTQVDPIGNQDVEGTRYSTKAVPPEDLEFWHPKHGGWRPVSDWGNDTDAEHGITGEGDDARALESHERGGFKPNPRAEDDVYTAPAVKTEAERKRAEAPKPTATPEQDARKAAAEKDYQEREGRWATKYRGTDEQRKDLIGQAKAGKLKERLVDKILNHDGKFDGKVPPSWQARLKVDAEGNPMKGHDFAKSLHPGSFAQVLAKAMPGAEKPGHKYLSRKPDGKGGYAYNYREAAKDKRGADIVNTHPSELIDADEYHAAQRAGYFDRDGARLASSRDTPAPSTEHLKTGAWMIDQWAGMYGHEVSQLQEFDPHDPRLVEREDNVRRNVEGRGDDADRYADWQKQGLHSRPPPISVVEREDGKLAVTDGHRRLHAARLAGKPVRAWVSWSVPTGKIDASGKPMIAGLTHELAIHNAMVRKEHVDPAIAMHYDAVAAHKGHTGLRAWMEDSRGMRPSAPPPKPAAVAVVAKGGFSALLKSALPADGALGAVHAWAALVDVAAGLSALRQYEHSAHLQSAGLNAYSLHLMFERLYTGLTEQYDALSEKLVAFRGATAADPKFIGHKSAAKLEAWPTPPTIESVLAAEGEIIADLNAAYDTAKAAKVLTHGLDDLLMKLVSDHETAVYLLQQVLGGKDPPGAAGVDVAA